MLPGLVKKSSWNEAGGSKAKSVLLMVPEVLFASTLCAEERVFPRRHPGSFFFHIGRACSQRSEEKNTAKRPSSMLRKLSLLFPPLPIIAHFEKHFLL